MSVNSLTTAQKESISKGLLRYYQTAAGQTRIEQLKQQVPYNKGWGVKRDKRLIRPILQFSKKNSLLREWQSIRAASSELKICYQGIWYCAKGCRKSAGGYIWRY